MSVTSVCRIAVPWSGVRCSLTWMQRSPSKWTLKLTWASACFLSLRRAQASGLSSGERLRWLLSLTSRT